MADNTENIGGVSVSITGDYSELASDFDAAVALAVSKGATLAEAIQSAMAVPDTAPLTQAFSQVGDAAVSAAGQMQLFDEATHVDYSDAAGQLNLFSTELESIGPSATQAAQGVMQLPVALGEVGDKAHETEGIFVEFGEKVSEIIEHPIQQFRALVEAIGPVGIGIAALAAGFFELAKGVTELVLEEGNAARETQNLADKLNLGFEQTKQLGEMASVVGVNIDALSRASMRLAVALDDPTSAAGAKVSAALDKLGISASDSGDALLKLLEKLAEIPDATERISAATAVMGRGAVQLEPLLNNYEALKQAVEDLGGQLDHDMVQKLLDANKAAGLLAIAWDHLKESLAVAFAPAVTAAMQMLTALLTDPKPMTLDQQIASLTQEITDLRIAAHGASAEVSNFFAASTGISDTGGIPAGLVAERQAALDLLKAQKDGIDRSKEYNAELDQSNKDQKQWAADAITATEAYAAAMYKAYGQLGVSNFSSLLKGTTDATGNVSQLSGMAAFDALASTLEGPRLAQAADNLEAQLQKAFHDGALSVEAFNADVDLIEGKLTAARDAGQNLGENLGKAFVLPSSPDSLPYILPGLIDKMAVFDRAVQNTAEYMKSEFPVALAAMAQGVGDVQQKIDAAVNQMPAVVAVLKQLAAGTDAVFRAPIDEQNALLKVVHVTAQASVDEMIAANAKIQASNATTATEKLKSETNTNKAILADAQQYTLLQEGNLKTQIALDAVRGTDATAEIERLTQLQYQTKALADAATGLGQVYVGVRKAFDDAFSSLSKGLADAIVNGKNLGDIFINVGKQIATSILDTVIKGALLPLQDELNKTGGLFDTLAKSITGSLKSATSGLKSIGLGGASGSGEVASEGNALPGGSPGDFGGETGGSTSSAGSAGGSGGSLGSLSSLTSLASLGVQIVSGIVQGFQLAHLSNLLGEIEITTRKMDNVLGENGSESIFGYGKLSSQTLDKIVGELSTLHNDNVAVISLLESGGGGGGGTGGGGGGGGGDNSGAFVALMNMLQNLQGTVSTIVAGAGGAVQSIGPIVTGVQTLTSALTTTTGTVTALASVVAQSLSAVASASGLQVGSNETFSSAATESGAALGVSTGGLKWGGPNSLGAGNPLDPRAMGKNKYGNYETAVDSYMREAVSRPDGGWDLVSPAGFPTITVPPGNLPNPSNMLPSTPRNLIPSTPVNNIGSSGGSFGGGGGGYGNAMVTVNALNPSSRGVADGIVTSLRQLGVKI